MDDDWGDIDDEPRLPRRAAPPTVQSTGLSRQQRFINTLAVVSALMLVLGVGLGFALGRATAPTPPAPAEVATLTVESTAPAEATASTEPTVVVEATPTPETTPTPPPKNNEPPKTPTQLDPDDGASDRRVPRDHPLVEGHRSERRHDHLRVPDPDLQRR